MAAEGELLLQFVAERDTPCPVCGYNLRAARAARCPECGRELHLTIGVQEKLHLPWLLSTIACWSTVFFSLMLAGSLWHGTRFHTLLEWVVAFTCFALSLAGVPLLFLRRQIVMWRPSRKWLLAAVVCTLWLFVIGTIVVVIIRAD